MLASPLADAASIRTGKLKSVPHRFEVLAPFTRGDIFQIDSLDAGLKLMDWWCERGRLDDTQQRRSNSHRRRQKPLVIVGPDGPVAGPHGPLPCVLDLRGDVPVSVHDLPPPANGLDVAAISADLAEYVDRDIVIDIAANGVPFHSASPEIVVAFPNHGSVTCLDGAPKLDAVVADELEKGRYVAFDRPPFFPCRIVPFSATPKPDGSTRPISDHTCPMPISSNSGGHPDTVRAVVYETVEDLVAGILALRASYGPAHIFMLKVDVRQAYRQLSVHATSLWRCVSFWRGRFILDVRLSFGQWSACSAFDQFTRAFQFAWRAAASRHPFLAVDDFDIPDEEQLAFITAADSETHAASPRLAAMYEAAVAAADGARSIGDAMRSIGLLDDHMGAFVGRLNALVAARIAVRILARWGLHANMKKLATEGIPAREKTILGIGTSTASFTLYVPHDRVEHALTWLLPLVDAFDADWDEVKSEVHRLMFFLKAVRRGRLHMSGFMIALRASSVGGRRPPGGRVRITQGMRRNIRWWLEFLGSSSPWNGVSYMVDTSRVLTGCATDASDWGFGVYLWGASTWGE